MHIKQIHKYILFYCLSLCIIAAFCIHYVASTDVSIVARFSTWQSYTNLLQYEVDNPKHGSLLNRKKIIVGWYDKKRHNYMGTYYIEADTLPEAGTGYMILPICFDLNETHCSDLRFSTINSDESNLEKLKDQFYDSVIPKDQIIDTKDVNKKRIYLNPRNEAFGTQRADYDVIPFGLKHQTCQLNLNTVVAPTWFLPGKPNEVLYVDIRDGIPYQGNIIIEQVAVSPEDIEEDNDIQVSNLSHPPTTTAGVNRYTIDANISGVTSINLTIQKKSRVRFTAGDKVIEQVFDPHEGPFQAFESGDLSLRQKAPTIRVIFPDEPQDLVVDYFDGNAWFDRQEIKASDTSEFKLTPKINLGSPMELRKNEVYIFYARLSLHGFPTDEPHQTFPLIAYPWGVDDNYRIGIYYQEFAKLHEIENDNYNAVRFAATTIYDIYNNPKIQSEAWGSDMFALVPVLLDKRHIAVEEKDDDEDNDEYRSLKLDPIHDRPLVAFLSDRLARAHNPQIIQVEFGSNKTIQPRNRIAHILLALWSAFGIIALSIYGWRIRNRRQKEWFDQAAKVETMGLMPGIPIWILLSLLILCITMGYALYTTIQLL